MSDKPTILVIDDDPAVLLGLAAVIKRHGYQVITAENGADGFQLAKQTSPDLILSDVMMPPPDGFELRRLMSLDPQLSTIPFIFLTARSDTEGKLSGLRGGADDYITKPFETEELLARIEAVFRRVRTEQARGRDQEKVIAEMDMEKLRMEILQNIHHELRTPLSNILMPLELVVNNKFSDPQEQSNFIRIALSNADRLESLVTDLVLLSSIDHGNLNYIRQPIYLDKDIRVPVYKRLERYKGKGLDFVFDVPAQGQITAPRREFIHALLHLLDNAFKFSPDQGRVELRLTPEIIDGATIDIKDEGPGVPFALREKVFERYYQVSQGDAREHEGMGVGLAIAQAVFSGLGGDVRILDSPKGCHVRAFLPDRRPGDLIYG
ncbi:MAG: hybrid sensor histidine kinase/response regulator [Chloroflexota bacterium]